MKQENMGKARNTCLHRSDIECEDRTRLFGPRDSAPEDQWLAAGGRDAAIEIVCDQSKIQQHHSCSCRTVQKNRKAIRTQKCWLVGEKRTLKALNTRRRGTTQHKEIQPEHREHGTQAKNTPLNNKLSTSPSKIIKHRNPSHSPPN